MDDVDGLGPAAFLQRLRRCKLAKWAMAYVATSFALLQGIEVVAEQFD